MLTQGFPNPSEEETHETLSLAELLTINMHAAKLFRMHGSAMSEAGIMDQDWLLVENTDKWKVGDIVIAEVDSEEFVRYLRKDAQGSLYLKAAGEKVADLYPAEYMRIRAVVRRVIRAYD